MAPGPGVGTHIDAPAHAVSGTPFIDEMPLPHFFGAGAVLSAPKQRRERITGDDLERAGGRAVRPGDVVIINTGWHHRYEDNEDYFARCPGLVPSAADWLLQRKVKVAGHDTQANDHPLATAIGPHRNGPLLPHLAKGCVEWSGGRTWDQDSPEWELTKTAGDERTRAGTPAIIGSAPQAGKPSEAMSKGWWS